MATTFHIYVPLYCHCTLHTDTRLLHISVKNNINTEKNCINYLPCYCPMCASNKYASQLPHILGFPLFSKKKKFPDFVRYFSHFPYPL